MPLKIEWYRYFRNEEAQSKKTLPGKNENQLHSWFDF